MAMRILRVAMRAGVYGMFRFDACANKMKKHAHLQWRIYVSCSYHALVCPGTCFAWSVPLVAASVYLDGRV